MQASNTTLVILGDKAAPALGTKRNGGFKAVERCSSTEDFRSLLSGGVSLAESVIVADSSITDTHKSAVEHLLSGLDRKNVKVLLVGVEVSAPLKNGAEVPARSGEKIILGGLASLGVEGVSVGGQQAKNPPKQPQKTADRQPVKEPVKPKQSKQDSAPKKSGKSVSSGWGAVGTAPAINPAPAATNPATVSSGWSKAGVDPAPIASPEPATVVSPTPTEANTPELVPLTDEPIQRSAVSPAATAPRTAADLLFAGEPTAPAPGAKPQTLNDLLTGASPTEAGTALTLADLMSDTDNVVPMASREVAPPVSRGGLPIQGLQGSRGSGEVIAVMAYKGGAGKSSLSLNLAAFLGNALTGTGMKACIVDAVPEQGDVAAGLELTGPTLVDILKYTEPGHRTMDAIRPYVFKNVSPGLDAVLAPTNFGDLAQWGTQLDGTLYNEVVEALRHEYAFVFLDCPVAEYTHNLYDSFIFPQANKVVGLVVPDSTVVGRMAGFLDKATQPVIAGGKGIDRSHIGIVINMAEDGIDYDVEDITGALGEWPCLGVFDSSPVWKRARNNFELVALQNNPEITEPLQYVLYRLTGDHRVRPRPKTAAAADSSPFGKLKGLAERLRGTK